MEGRLRILFLIASLAASPGCAMFGGERTAAAPDDAEAISVSGGTADPIIEAEIERREIARPRIDTEDFEAGAYVGIMSIEDFGTNAVYGVRFAYHVNEDLFVEATFGRSRAGKTSYERLSGSVELLTDGERDYQYYALSLGWNALPGEIFLGANRAYNTAIYLIGGIGSTRFAGDDRFTANAGLGYRLLITDSIAMHLDFRDQIFDIDLLGSSKTSHNLETHLGLTAFF
jgi:outer membrane beta-barrel protein